MMKTNAGRRRWLGGVAVAASAGFLMACGGGGNTDSQGNLIVKFDYPNNTPANNVNVLDDISIKPILSGLGNETPRFSWYQPDPKSPVPTTLNLNGKTGEITGYLAEPGTVSGLVVKLTVDGYQDNVMTGVSIQAQSPFTIQYGTTSWPTISEFVLPKATNLSGNPISAPKWTGLQAGDTVTYRLLPNTDATTGGAILPYGMGFSTRTGAFSGFMEDMSGYDYRQLSVRVEATITRAGKSAKLMHRVSFKNYP